MAGLSFIELPTDIHLSILAFIPWTDIILSVRRVSRLFEDVTRAKELWTSLITHPKYIGLLSCKIERPLHTYSAAELEEIFLRWRRTIVFWRRPGHFTDEIQTRMISPAFDISFSNQCILLPGGRWLIISTINASVLYLDLACPHPRHRVMIPPQLTSEHRTSLKGSHISIDAQSHSICGEPLSFTLSHAVFFKDSRLMTHQTLSVSVWHVQYTPGGSQGTSDLVASRLFEVRKQDAPSPSYIASMTATTEQVVYTLLNTSSESGRYTYIARRNHDPSNDILPTPVLVTAAPFSRDQGDVLSYGPTSAFVSSTHLVTMTVNIPSMSRPVTKILSIASMNPEHHGYPTPSIIYRCIDSVQPSSILAMSPPFHVYNSTRWIYITTFCKVVGIIVPDEVLDPRFVDPNSQPGLPPTESTTRGLPTFLTLYSLRRPPQPGWMSADTMISFGYHHVSISHHNTHRIISIAWPDDDQHILNGLKSFTFPTNAVDTVIDEVSGTIVRTNGKDITVSQTK